MLSANEENKSSRMTELSSASTENWRSSFTIWKQNKLKYLSVWKPFEHKEFSCNTLFFKHFHQFWHLSDKMSLIKWISRCLFTENVSCCDWLTQNLLLSYLNIQVEIISPCFLHVHRLWCCCLARLASLLAWLVGNEDKKSYVIFLFLFFL